MKKLTALLFISLFSSIAFADEVTISCGTQVSSFSKAELVQMKKDAKKSKLDSSKIFKEDNEFHVNISTESQVARKVDENNKSFWARQEQVTKDLTLKVESILNENHADVSVECGISG